ncbi:hypothetical protein HYALB_00008992 [Hymenoscyphus albidus]|uniref:Uncharacterized protein n=1 Tax=Hymenoscyphus albidus TaxID=595503 RepID=A0A9N9LUN7_9HELO|nr:hypothetical protein HYALB_00008992 [Hymenoscyphus albidus]
MSNKMDFLDLPGEIRNQIYTVLLVLPLNTSGKFVPVPTNEPSIYPQILAVCKSIHHEAKQILYGKNIFYAHAQLLTGLPLLRQWWSSSCTVRSPEMISMIRRYRLRVRLDCDPRFSAQQAEESFTGSEEFYLEAIQAQYGGSDYSVLKLFEGVRGVTRATVIGGVGTFPEYAAWLQKSMMAPIGSEFEAFESPIGEEFEK